MSTLNHSLSLFSYIITKKKKLEPIRAPRRGGWTRSAVSLSGSLQRGHVLLTDFKLVGRPVVSFPHGLPHKQPHGFGVVLQRQRPGSVLTGNELKDKSTVKHNCCGPITSERCTVV